MWITGRKSEGILDAGEGKKYIMMSFDEIKEKINNGITNKRKFYLYFGITVVCLILMLLCSGLYAALDNEDYTLNAIGYMAAGILPRFIIICFGIWMINWIVLVVLLVLVSGQTTLSPGKSTTTGNVLAISLFVGLAIAVILPVLGEFLVSGRCVSEYAWVAFGAGFAMVLLIGGPSYLIITAGKKELYGGKKSPRILTEKEYFIKCNTSCLPDWEETDDGKKKLRADENKKKQIQDAYLKSKPVMYYLPKVIWWGGFLMTVIFWILCKINTDWFLVYNITSYNYGEQDKLIIWYIIIGAIVIFAFLAFVTDIFCWRISGANISERKSESILYADGKLDFLYRNSVNSSPGDRVVKKILLSEQEKITYNKTTKRIMFTGVHHSVYYKHFKTREIEAGPDIMEGKLCLFDYFTPSLINVIRASGYEIEEVE